MTPDRVDTSLGKQWTVPFLSSPNSFVPPSLASFSNELRPDIYFLYCLIGFFVHILGWHCCYTPALKKILREKSVRRALEKWEGYSRHLFGSLLAKCAFPPRS